MRRRRRLVAGRAVRAWRASADVACGRGGPGGSQGHRGRCDVCLPMHARLEVVLAVAKGLRAS